MGREYKTVHKAYAAWECEKEIAALNKESENGWQLIKGNSFSAKFKWNPEVRYKYQLDHQNKIEEMGRYIETFREQGWEYVNTTFNGWSYFRKLYDPSLQEEECEIFTDESSKEEMHQSWIKVMLILAIFFVICTVFNVWICLKLPILPFRFGAIIYVIGAVFLIACVALLCNPVTRQKMKLGYVVTVTALTFCGVIGSFILLGMRPEINFSFKGDVAGPFPSEMENALEWIDFDVTYEDCYFMDLSIEADEAMTFVLVNEADEVLYTVREANHVEEDYRIDLEKGNYRIYFMDFVGGSLYVNMNLN